MAVTVGGREFKPVSRRAAQLIEAQGLTSVLAGWPCLLDGVREQLIIAVPSGLLLVTDAGINSVPWSDIRTVDANRLNEHTFTLYNSGSREEFQRIVEAGTQGATIQPTAFFEGSMPYESRPATWRRERNRRMVSALQGVGGKWRMALDGERFAWISIVGTSDWEDYASAAMMGMVLETATDLEERVAHLEDQLNAIHSTLLEIRDALAGARSNENGLH